MRTQTFLKRIERVEQAVKAQSRFSPECICFPDNEAPFVGFPIEEELAMKVKCPLHGDRFKSRSFFVYVADWLREKLPMSRWSRDPEQYQKAWDASFPPELWPAEEEWVDGKMFLRLKDGTLLPTNESG